MSWKQYLIRGIAACGIIYGIGMIAAAAITFAGAPQASQILNIDDAQLTTEVMSVLLALYGLIHVVGGVVGWREAPHPEKLGLFIKCAACIACVALILIAMKNVGGVEGIWHNLVTAVWALIGVFLASQVQRDQANA